MTLAPKYLVFSNKEDITSDFVIRELSKRGLPYLRINTEDIYKSYVTSEPLKSRTKLHVNNHEIVLDNVVSAYFRRPEIPKPTDKSLKESAINYCIDEWSYILKSLYLELGNKWFSHPNNIILAEDKPKQLRLASKLGFSVPETIISNSSEAIEPLFNSGSVVAKPLRHALLQEDEIESVIFTTEIFSLEEIDPNQISLAPVIFQRKIDKKYDLRVTVVNEEVFAASIHSQTFEANKVDWRRGSANDLRHEQFNIDKETAKKCINLVKELDINFGAIDLILDQDDEIWFLECNPNGQWAWIEVQTGMPISSAIADAMESM